MLACNRLRIDPRDGFTVVDYRIEDGGVERRSLRMSDSGSPVVEQDWQQLTPGQLSSVIMQNRLVAHWLTRRMGIFPLVRACTENSDVADLASREHSSGMAA